MPTIDEVIRKMDDIVAFCKKNELRAGYFAVLYRFVTIRIKEGIVNNEFEDNERMEMLDVLFAQRYFDAWNAWIANTPPTKSWQQAFDASGNSDCIVLQHLLLGINAHINLDLGISAAKTMKGKKIVDLKNDFDRINQILASLVDSIKSNIRKVSPVFGLLAVLAKGKDDMLMNFSIELARDGAWKFAGEYFRQPNDQMIQIRDEKIAGLATGLVKHGKWISFLLKVIRWGEFRSVSRNMEILESVANKNVAGDY
jgi:hypothetical protein